MLEILCKFGMRDREAVRKVWQKCWDACQRSGAKIVPEKKDDYLAKNAEMRVWRVGWRGCEMCYTEPVEVRASKKTAIVFAVFFLADA